MKTIEHMLEVVGRYGISLSEGTTIEELADEWGRDAIERQGFELLFVALGGECIEPAHTVLENSAFGQPLPRQRYSFRYVSDDVWHLDYECIGGLEDYYEIVERLAQLTRGDLVLSEPEGHLLDFHSGQAWIDLGLTEQPLQLKFNYDWLDPAIIYACNDRLIKLGSPKRFAAQSCGQSNIIICQTPERIAALNAATGMNFMQRYD